jgi:hypothetical protein
MADSKRLACLKALTTYLATEITLDNGYKHDLSTLPPDEDGVEVRRVVRGRDLFDDDDPVPMVSILESPNPDRFPNLAGKEDSGEADQKDKWIIYFQGWVNDDKDNPTDPAYELMADVKKALAKLTRLKTETGSPMYPDIFLLGGLIADMGYEPGTVRPPAPEYQSSKAFFWMRVILEFVEDFNDPYKLD